MPRIVRTRSRSLSRSTSADMALSRRRAKGQGRTRTRVERRRVHRDEGPIRRLLERDPLGGILRTGPRIRPFRADGYLHVSDLVSKCLRKMALAEANASPMPAQEIWDSQGITFHLGEALHSYVINRFRDEEDTLFGAWKCLCGETRIEGPYTYGYVKEQGFTCEHCNQPVNVYDELTLRNERLNLIGNVDAAFLRAGYLFIGEIKSINQKGWKELDRGPSPDYTVQVLLYWWMAREMGYKLFDHVSILYAAKDWMMTNPYREFIIKAEDNLHRISTHLEEAEELADFRFNNGPLPTRTMCPTIQSPHAKRCEFAEECFREK